MTNPTPDSGGTLNDLIKRWFEMEEEILQQDCLLDKKRTDDPGNMEVCKRFSLSKAISKAIDDFKLSTEALMLRSKEEKIPQQDCLLLDCPLDCLLVKKRTDDPGNLEVCERFSKAFVNGFMESKNQPEVFKVSDAEKTTQDGWVSHHWVTGDSLGVKGKLFAKKEHPVNDQNDKLMKTRKQLLRDQDETLNFWETSFDLIENHSIEAFLEAYYQIIFQFTLFIFGCFDVAVVLWFWHNFDRPVLGLHPNIKNKKRPKATVMDTSTSKTVNSPDFYSPAPQDFKSQYV